jgi:hypothetical protein
MKKSSMLMFAVVTLIAQTVAMREGLLFAQQTPRDPMLVGAWQLLRVDNVYADGRREALYGAHPHGMLMFDAQGRYSLQIFSQERIRFALNDKARGSAQEYQAAVQGSNAHFGEYAIDAATHSIRFRIAQASFPNWEGTEQKRSFTLIGDELKYTVPVPTTGANGTGEVVWQRIR